MLELEQQERDEVLHSFQVVISHLWERRDEKTITALALLKDNKLRLALGQAEEANSISSVLTSIKSYLESEYKLVSSVH